MSRTVQVRLSANMEAFAEAMKRASEKIAAFAGYWNDRQLTRLLNLQPCDGNHEAVLPCPLCGAAI